MDMMDQGQGRVGRENEEDILAYNPRAINVAEFASARAAELKTMTQAIMTMGGMRRTFQKLPRHMRRRAMSHDLRRLPKRLRDSEERTMLKSLNKKKSDRGKEGGDEEPTPAKRSRRHRRRLSNLRQEYQRRQRSHAWLETHLWHAKRFKMAELWGHKIPLHPSDKSVRATYRAMARHCLLQDISYLRVLELSGPQGMILRAVSHLTSPLTGLTCAAASYLTGQRHGETVFYKNDCFPEGAIGPVSFLWRAEGPPTAPSSTPETEGTGAKERGEKSSVGPAEKFGDCSVKRLWLWAHPSCSETLLKELTTASKMENKMADSGGKVTVRRLKNGPLRFRLQGPLSHPVLLNALKMADVAAAAGSDQPRTWWEDYYANPGQMQAHAEQSSAWEVFKGVTTPAVLPPRCVLGLTVRDPRNLLPIKKLKIKADREDFVHSDHLPAEVMHGFPPSVSVSPIWEESVRQSVTSTQIPIHKLNKMRSERLVPGQELPLGPQESRVPVLLLQQPGIVHSVDGSAKTTRQSQQQGRMGFGSGWDVIVPSGWGMAFWVALIFRGARAAGLQESRSCRLQQGRPHFPEAYPDTAAGGEWEDKAEQEMTEKFKRWPPAKRPNYGKLGVVSPFRCPWKKLLEEWRDAKKDDMEYDDDDDVAASGTLAATTQASNIDTPIKEARLPAGKASDESKTFFVLRERSKLEKLSEALVACHRPPKVTKTAKMIKQIGRFGKLGAGVGAVVTEVEKSSIEGDTSEVANGHVSHAQNKESLTDHWQTVSSVPAELCQTADSILVGVKLSMASRGVPHPFAMICLPNESDLSSFALDQKYSPTEPIHKEFKLQRTAKKKNKKRKGPTNKQTDETPREQGKDAKDGKFEVAPDRKLFKSCTRRVIGFVTDGANAFISGSGQAVGYCCMLGLLTLIEERPQDQRTLVLVRDTKAVQYRFAYLEIVTYS